MEMLTLFRPKIEKGELCWSDEIISLPFERVERVFYDVSGSLLKALLPGTIKIPGFRHPHRAPRAMLFRALRNEAKPYVLSGLLWGHMEDLLVELHRARVRDVRKNLAEYVSQHGEDVMTLALQVHKRPGVRKLVDSISATEDPTDRTSKFEPISEVKSSAKIESAPVATTLPATTTSDDLSANGTDHSACQRTISRLEKELGQKEKVIQNERRQNGRLSEEIGQLRETLQQRDADVARLTGKLERLQGELETYEQQAAKHTRLDEWETRLRDRDAALTKAFGENRQLPTEQLLEANARVHDLEAMHTLLALALDEARERRQAAFAATPTTEHIPLTECIQAVTNHIERRGQAAAATAIDTEIEPQLRTEAAEQLQHHLAVIDHLHQLEPGDETVALGDRSTPFNQLIASLQDAEEVELSLTGTVFYEGPQAWLRTEEHSLGLPFQFIEEEQLVTGDEVRLHFVHSPDDPFAWYADVLRKVERHEVNDSLRLDDGGFWVQAPDGARLDVSPIEMLRSGIQPDSPVQVQAPDVPLGPSEPVYVRLAKALPIPFARRPAPALRRRTRRAERFTPDQAGSSATAVSMPRLFRNQHVLIVGGDGLENDFLDVARRMGGQVTWQSGFSDFARAGDRAAQADIVIVATGRSSHAVANSAAAQARRANRQIAYFHGPGRSSFVRFLLNTFGDEWDEEAAG